MLLKAGIFTPAILLTLSAGFAASTRSPEWPQWRGPTRDGQVPVSRGTPSSWPLSFHRAWGTEVGEGYSSPVVSAGRVYVHARRDPEEVVMALDLASGRPLWEQKYAAAFQKNQYALRMAKGPYATPLVLSNRLFTLGATALLKAWDPATGRQLWEKDFSQTIDTSKMFCGTAASPLGMGGLVVVQVGSDAQGGQLLALHADSGKAEWEWHGPGPGYASPILISILGQTQVVALTESSMVGLEANTGRQLWSVPFRDEWHENIVTPLWTGSLLVVSGVRQGTHAYNLQETDGQWQASEVWKNADVSMYMSSPVYGDGLIYGHSSKKSGEFTALEARTGAIRWTSDGGNGRQASVLLTPDHVVCLTNDGKLIVARRRTPAFEIERSYPVAGGETWAMPVLLGPDLLVRDASGIIRLTPGH